MEMLLKNYKKTRKEIVLEIMEIFKSKGLSIALIDDVMEFTKQEIHNDAHYVLSSGSSLYLNYRIWRNETQGIL